MLGDPGLKYASLDSDFWDSDNQLTIHEQCVLELPFSEEEIHQAVFASNPNGAPGPDDFTFKFYHLFGS